MTTIRRCYRPLFWVKSVASAGGEEAQETAAAQRLDKWLWVARFYKQRKLAHDAIVGGHVHLNGQRVKPARLVRCQDELSIVKGDVTFTIVVLQLGKQRGSATVAATLYAESEASCQQRMQQLETRRLERSFTDNAPVQRPDKRQRRHLAQLKSRQFE
ncbi:MAG: RNA-binding protein [Gammaproteobacteria bacterium]|nr:RNA-binding protein [Gammaproteobacteria bacterium]